MAIIEPDKQRRVTDRRASKSSGRSVMTSSFLRKQSVKAPAPAKSVAARSDDTASQTVIELDDVRFRAFEAALERPAQTKPRLARLLSEKSILED